MQESYSDELLSNLKTLISTGFKPVVEGSPVKATEFFVVDGFGSFRVREYEGYDGISMETGQKVRVPSSLQLEFNVDPTLSEQLKNKSKSSMNIGQSGLLGKLHEIRELVLAGQTAVILPGVGTFKVVSQEKPSGLKYFLNLEVDDTFHKSLQAN